MRAFFLKDLRVAARGGTVLPGVGVVLVLQAAVCFGLAAWAIFKSPIPGPAWRIASSLAGTVAFVLAFIAPSQAAAWASAQEGHPDIAESLATAPVGPTRFFLGKAALPVLQGLAMQVALLPMWMFLAGTGMMTFADVLRVVVAMFFAIPVAALGGATRYGGLGSPRVALMLRAQAKRGAAAGPLTQPVAQQTWLALLGMAWVVQAMRGASMPGISSVASNVLQDLARPIVPLVGMDRGSFLRFFGVPVPVVLLSVAVLGALAVLRLSAAVAASARASDREREHAWTALAASRVVLVLYVTGAMWPLSPASAVAGGGLVALWLAVAGVQREGRAENALTAVFPCVLPAIFSLPGGGIAALACWTGIAAVCAATAAAMPPARTANEVRRAIAVAVVLGGGFTAPIIAAAVTHGVLDPLGPIFAAWTWVSPPAAVVSLSSMLLGAIPPWEQLRATVPAIETIPPALGAPLLFASIALVAIVLKPKPKPAIE